MSEGNGENSIRIGYYLYLSKEVSRDIKWSTCHINLVQLDLLYLYRDRINLQCISPHYGYGHVVVTMSRKGFVRYSFLLKDFTVARGLSHIVVI